MPISIRVMQRLNAPAPNISVLSDYYGYPSLTDSHGYVVINTYWQEDGPSEDRVYFYDSNESMLTFWLADLVLGWKNPTSATSIHITPSSPSEYVVYLNQPYFGTIVASGSKCTSVDNVVTYRWDFEVEGDGSVTPRRVEKICNPRSIINPCTLGDTIPLTLTSYDGAEIIHWPCDYSVEESEFCFVKSEKKPYLVLFDTNSDDPIDLSDSWIKLQSNLEKRKLYDSRWHPLPSCPADQVADYSNSLGIFETTRGLLASKKCNTTSRIRSFARPSLHIANSFKNSVFVSSTIQNKLDSSSVLSKTAITRSFFDFSPFITPIFDVNFTEFITSKEQVKNPVFSVETLSSLAVPVEFTSSFQSCPAYISTSFVCCLQTVHFTAAPSLATSYLFTIPFLAVDINSVHCTAITSTATGSQILSTFCPQVLGFSYVSSGSITPSFLICDSIVDTVSNTPGVAFVDSFISNDDSNFSPSPLSSLCFVEQFNASCSGFVEKQQFTSIQHTSGVSADTPLAFVPLHSLHFSHLDEIASQDFSDIFPLFSTSATISHSLDIAITCTVTPLYSPVALFSTVLFVENSIDSEFLTLSAIHHDGFWAAQINPAYKNSDFDFNYQAIYSFAETDFPYTVKGKITTETEKSQTFTVIESFEPVSMPKITPD